MMLCVAAVIACTAAGQAAAPRDSLRALPVTGDITLDFFGLRDLSGGPHLAGEQPPGAVAGDRKSPWIAAGLSLVLPGAGEFYDESYLKSALFLAVEAGAWILAYSWDKRGDRQTDSFQDFANAHWSVVQYAQFAQEKLSDHTQTYAWLKPGTEGQAPWDRVDWNELNRMERDIAGYYSHTLPPHGDQQYYEEIGKYPQFNQGWNDANLSLSPDYATVKGNLTPNDLFYAVERGKANTYYEHATLFVSVAIINHLVSSIDAALSAGWYNSRVHAEMGVQTVPVGGTSINVPVMKLAYRF